LGAGFGKCHYGFSTLTNNLESYKLMKVEDLTAAAYFAGWRVVRWLPERTAYRFFDFVADRISSKNGKSFKRLESNLKRVVPQLSDYE